MPTPPAPKARPRIPVTKAIVQGTPDQQQREVSNLESRLRWLEEQMQALQSVTGTGADDDSDKVKGLYNSVPPDVAPAGSRGTSNRASRGNHTHRGVTSIAKSSTVYGAITMSGAGVTQVGNDFAIPGFSPTYGTPVDVGSANAAGAASTLARSDHVHRGYDPLNYSTTPTGNAAATETDLFSYSVPGGTLAVNGDGLHFFAAGTFGAVASADKQLRVKFGATTVFDTGALAVTSLDWRVEGRIIRSGATTQKAIVSVMASGTTLAFGPVDYTAPGETLSGAVVLKITGVGTNASDVVGEVFGVAFYPSP